MCSPYITNISLSYDGKWTLAFLKDLIEQMISFKFQIYLTHSSMFFKVLFIEIIGVYLTKFVSSIREIELSSL